MIRSFLTVSTGTLASRLLGFARDSMIAALLGAGPVADAFLAAFQLINGGNRRVGFASACQAFGHRELLGVLKSFGLVQDPVVTISA